jgi:hypothetical protein
MSQNWTPPPAGGGGTVPNKLKPAIIGGAIVGILSAIPFVNWANICCCLWAVLGGVIASYLYIKASPTPVSAGEGATLGALAGIVGAVIYIIIGIPLAILVGTTMNGAFIALVERTNPDQAEMMRRQMDAGTSIVSAIVGGIIGAILLLIFSVLGGLLAVPLFEKRKGGMAPPPAPQSGFGA